MSLVSIFYIEKGRNSIRNAIIQSLHIIDYHFEKDVKNVVIKPNMCYYWDFSTGQTTDPKFVGAIIEILREKISSNINISIVESDASAMKCKYAFRMLGYEKLAKDYSVKLINLSQEKGIPSEVPVGHQLFHLMVPKTIQEADLKINLPKIKFAMEPIKLTCALKNIFGCNPYPKKFKYHFKLGEAIIAINKAMKFNLNIIDGNIVSGIQPRKLGLVMASTDPVAIDTVAAEIAGINPKKIKYLQLANKEGLGNTSFISKGMPLSYFKAAYPRKNIKKKLMEKAYNLAIRTGFSRKLGLG